MNCILSNLNSIKVATISIIDISGELVVTLNAYASSNKIDISKLQSGVYFVKFNTDYKTLEKNFIKK